MGKGIFKVRFDVLRVALALPPEATIIRVMKSEPGKIEIIVDHPDIPLVDLFPVFQQAQDGAPTGLESWGPDGTTERHLRGTDKNDTGPEPSDG